jgi:hypothetical protein
MREMCRSGVPTGGSRRASPAQKRLAASFVTITSVGEMTLLGRCLPVLAAIAAGTGLSLLLFT